MDLVKPSVAGEVIRNRTKPCSKVCETWELPSSPTLTIAQLRQPVNHPLRRIGIEGIARESTVPRRTNSSHATYESVPSLRIPTTPL